jgi:endoglucanase
MINNKRIDAFYTKNGNILTEKNEIFHVKGVSWFGFETQDFVVNGLWIHDMDFYVNILKENDINVLRIPFSEEWIYYHFDLYPDEFKIIEDPSLFHKKSIEIFDILFDKLESENIYVLLDLHRLHKEYISELWYSPIDDLYTTDMFFKTWYTMIDRYGNRSNLLGIDLLNEPHGQATWGSFDPDNDWKLFIEYAIPRFNLRYPHHQWLFFVEGIDWGHTFRDYREYPINKNFLHQLVFSPHAYGKSVVPTTSTDPDILYSTWDADFGFLQKEFNLTVVPGEWGGQTDLDSVWMTILGQYLIDSNMRNNFFWSLGPNSNDVDGLLLNDWTSLDTFKINLMKTIQPHPGVNPL